LSERYQLKLNFKKMPITKLDLCKSEWLELVFDDRNKLYGAYDIRKHYAQNLTKALVFTTIGFVGILLGYSLFLTHKPTIITDRTIPVVIDPRIPKTKRVEPVKPPKVDPPKVKSIKFVALVAKPDDNAKNVPKIDELKEAAISTVTQQGTTSSGPVEPPAGPTTQEPSENTEILSTSTVEVMPQFPGGDAAWSKFLQRNLRYPAQASEAHAQGKVYVTFVVEKDGHLSDMQVLRGVGFGLDDEAMRVLKLVPPWKPGIQNGRPVRVRYTMPFNFQLPADEN